MDRRLDIIGVVVLAGLAVGTVLGLISHNARLYLLEGAVPSLVFALACLGSLRASKPLIYRFAVELIGPDTPKGRDVVGAWRYPGFRRAFQVITAAWGIAYLIEVAARLVVVEITSTGIALLFSKLVPYACAVLALGLDARLRRAREEEGGTWLRPPGPWRPRRRRCRAVRIRGPAYTLVRCAGR